jgi:protein-S-isoprenylcysteine O-methyltransferase Ste14
MKLPSPGTISLIFLASEVALVASRHARTQNKGRDRLTLPLLWLVITLSITAGFYCRGAFPQFQVPHTALAYITGLFLFVLGIVIRWTAITQLGRFFTVNVAIAEDHQLVNTGLYGYVRHPSYSGTLLTFFGFGLCLTNWVSLAVIFVPVTIAFLWRMKVEEAALREALGEAYARYSVRTRRLIPGVY